MGDLKDDKLTRSIGIIAEAYDLKAKPTVVDVFNRSFLPPKPDRIVRSQNELSFGPAKWSRSGCVGLTRAPDARLMTPFIMTPGLSVFAGQPQRSPGITK